MANLKNGKEKKDLYEQSRMQIKDAFGTAISSLKKI